VNRLIIKVKEIRGTCPVFKPGDKIVIDGPEINLKESDAVCIHALSNLSTVIVALREGIHPYKLGLAPTEDSKVAYYRCFDPGPPYTEGGTVLFEVKREQLK